MSDNQRKSPRHEVHVDVTLTYQDGDPLMVRTRDISDGGMFLVVNDTSTYPLGEMLHLRYYDPDHDNADTKKDAIIVRVADNGLGIAFVELDEF